MEIDIVYCERTEQEKRKRREENIHATREARDKIKIEEHRPPGGRIVAKHSSTRGVDQLTFSANLRGISAASICLQRLRRAVAQHFHGEQRRDLRRIVLTSVSFRPSQPILSSVNCIE